MSSFGRVLGDQGRAKRKSRFHDADAGILAAGSSLNIQAALGKLCQNPQLTGLINIGRGQSFGPQGTGQGQSFGLHGAGQGQNFGLQGAGQGHNFSLQGGGHGQNLGLQGSGQNFGPHGTGQGQNFGLQGQRSQGLMSSAGGPSRYSNTPSSSLPSLFGCRSQNQPSQAVQKQIDAERASNILATFGLSSRDLDELSRYPEEKLTPECLPETLMQIKRRRNEEGKSLKYGRDDCSPRQDGSYRPSHDDWEEERHFRKRSYESHDSGLDPVVDYGHGRPSRESRYDRKDYERERLRGYDDFYREEMHLSESPHNFGKFDSDYGRVSRLPSPPRAHERSLFERKRGSPSQSNMNDYHGFLPKIFPHLCSLCDLAVHSVQEWNQHKNATTHRRLCQLLVEIYPEWNPDAFPTQGSDSLVLQSTNLAPGILGAPPPGPLIPNRRMMGGVDSHAALGPNRKSPMANKQGNNIYRPKQPVRMGANDELGRVVHISQLPRVRCTNIDLIKLAEPFGNVTNSLVVKTKSEAFIELAYTEAAQAMVKYYRNKPAFLRGSVVRVDLSQKYKKMTIKGQESEENSRVVHISNLPSVGYSDAEIVSLGMPFGRVTNYLLMRVKNQVFLEMESHQAGMTMVEKFKKMPLLFHGRELKVYLSQKYKNLVLRKQGKDVAELMKNKDQDDSFSLGSNRKRGRSDSPSSKGVRSPSLKRKAQDKPKTSTGSDQEKVQLDSPEEGKDPKHTEGEDPGEIKKVQEEPLPDIESYAQLSEAEEELLLAYTESVKDEAETADAEGVMETEAEAETGFSNKSESKEEVGDAQPNPQLTEKPTQKDVWCPKYTEEYFSLDEADDVAQKRKTDTNDKRDEQDIKKQSPDGKENSEAEIKQDQDVKSTSHSACVEPVSDDAESLSPLPEEYRLGPYRPNNPVGLDYVVQKTGYYCKLCRLFYTTEEVAKQAHCSSMNHYQKLKKMLAKHAADYREKRAFAKDSEMTEELCNK